MAKISDNGAVEVARLRDPENGATFVRTSDERILYRSGRRGSTYHVLAQRGRHGDHMYGFICDLLWPEDRDKGFSDE